MSLPLIHPLANAARHIDIPTTVARPPLSQRRPSHVLGDPFHVTFTPPPFRIAANPQMLQPRPQPPTYTGPSPYHYHPRNLPPVPRSSRNPCYHHSRLSAAPHHGFVVSTLQTTFSTRCPHPPPPTHPMLHASPARFDAPTCPRNCLPAPHHAVHFHKFPPPERRPTLNYIRTSYVPAARQHYPPLAQPQPTHRHPRFLNQCTP